MTDRHSQKPYPLRMPEDLRARLESDANYAGRSLHSEILRRLNATIGSDPLAMDPAQLVISIPNKVYNKIRNASVSNKTLPNEEISRRLLESFEARGAEGEPAVFLNQAIRLSDAQGMFAGVLAALCRNVIERYTPEELGLTERNVESVHRVLSKSIHGVDFDQSDYVELVGIAALLDAVKFKERPSESKAASVKKKS